jgi:hypothetical protein
MQPLDAARAAAVDLLRPTIRPNLRPELAELISACWHPQPAERPTAKYVCAKLSELFPDVDTVPEEAEKCCVVA